MAEYGKVLAPFLFNFQPRNMKDYKSRIKGKVTPIDVIRHCKGGMPKPKFLCLLKLYDVLSEGRHCNTLVAILERILSKNSQEMKRFLETTNVVSVDEAEDAVAVAFEELFRLILKMAGPHRIVAVSPQHVSGCVGKCTVRSNSGEVKSVKWFDGKSDSAADDKSFVFSRRNPVKLICSFAQCLETANAELFITRFSEHLCTMMCDGDLSEDVQEQAVVLWSKVVCELGLLPASDQTSDGEVDFEVGYLSETILTQFLFAEVLKPFQQIHQQSALGTASSYGNRSKQLLLNVCVDLLSTGCGLADLERLVYIKQALEQVFPLLSLDAASAVEERVLELARKHLGGLKIERFRTDLSVLLLLYSKSTNLRHDTDVKDGLFVAFAKSGSDQCKGEVSLLLQEELKHRPQVFTSLLTGAVHDSNQLSETFLQLLATSQELHPLQALASVDRRSLLEASDAILQLLKGASTTRSDDELDLLLSMARDMLSCPDVVSELVSSDMVKVFAALVHRRPSQTTACILTVIAEHRYDRFALLQAAIDEGFVNASNVTGCDVSPKTFTEILRDSATVSMGKESPAYLGDVLIKNLLGQLETLEELTSAHRSKLLCLLRVLSDKDLGGRRINAPTSLSFSDYVRAAASSVCQSLARFCARNLRCSSTDNDSTETDSCLALELLFRLCNVDGKRTKDSLSRVFPTVPLPSNSCKSPLGLMSRSDVHEELLELFFCSPGTLSSSDKSIVVTQHDFSAMSKKLSDICDKAEKLKENEVIVPYPKPRKGVTGENKVEVFGEVYSVVTPPPEFESHIPANPLTHVPSTKANVTLVLQSQDEGFPLLIEGQTGVGKSAAIMEAARLLNRPVVRFNLSSSVTCGDIIGRVSLSSDSRGLLTYEKGPFTKAFESGVWLLLDELNLASDDILQSIESALDTGLLYIDDPASAETSSVIKKHEHFRLFATQNPHTGSFKGTRSSLSSTFVSRFHTVSFHPPSNEDLEAIVTDVLKLASTSGNRECPRKVSVVAKQWARRMVNFHYTLSRVKMESEKNQPYAEITVRDLMKWASGMSSVLKENASAHNGLSPEQVNERFVFEARCTYETRFRDKEARKAIQETLLDPNAFGFPGFQTEPPLSVEYQQESPRQAEELSIRPCVVYNDFQADYLTDDHLSMLRFHREFTHRIMKKSGGILYCPFQVHQWNAKCEDTGAVYNIVATGFRLYARYLPRCFHKDLQEMLKEHWNVGTDMKFDDVEPEVVTPFIVTDHVKKAWMYILHALKQQQPVLVVGPEGCGKSDMIMWLACLLGKQINSWCLTSDTETSDLVGKIVPKKPAEWVDGVVTKSVKDGEWLLLDNVNEAEPAVLERLNPLLEQKPMWVLTERGETENMFDSYVKENGFSCFRFLATMTAPTSCRDVLRLSPALANRLTIVSVTDVGFAEGPTRNLSALLLCHDNPRTVLDEKGIDNSPVMKAIKAVEKFLFELHGGSEISPCKGLSISLRTLVRIILGAHRIHKKIKDRNKCSLARALVTACDMCVMQQIQDRKGPDYKSISEIFERFNKEIATSEGLPEIKPFDFVTNDLLGQSEYALDRVKTPCRCHYANVILYAFCTGQAVLLEGPAATGKTSLVEFIGRNLKMGLAGILYKTINSESTSIQDYFGTFIPCGNGNFAELQGPLTTAVAEGAFFLSDEFNLAEPSVLNALFPLLEGRQSITSPVSGKVIDVKEGFLFFATQNSALYADRKQLSPSLRNRFLQMQVSDFAPGELAFILQTRKFSSKVPFKTAEDAIMLEKTFRVINNQIRCRAVMFGTNSTLGLTVRDLIKWMERFIALSRCRVNEGQGAVVSLAAAGLAMLVPKLKPVTPIQRSNDKASSVVLMEAMKGAGLADVPQRIQSPNIDIQNGVCLLFDGITFSALTLNCDSETVQTVSKPMNPEQYKRAFAQAHVALQCLEPVLLIGPTTFKSKLARDYLVARGTDRYVVIQLSSDTQVGDLIGQIHPYQFDAAVSNLITTAQQLCERLKHCKLDDDKRFAMDEVYEKLVSCREVLKTTIKPTAAGYTAHDDDPMEGLILQETVTNKAREEAEAEIFDHETYESDPDDLSSVGDDTGTDDNVDSLFNRGDSEDDDYSVFDDDAEPLDNDKLSEPSAQFEPPELSADSDPSNDARISGSQVYDFEQAPIAQHLEGTELSDTTISPPSDSDSDEYIPLEDEDIASGKETTLIGLPEELGRNVRTFEFNSDDCFHDVSRLLSKVVECLNDETTDFLMKKYLSTLSLLKQASTNVQRPVFLFRDGPVTRAVKEGMSIIFEDINLPSQAVIERLNSLFEASRVLCLSEDVSASIITDLPDDSSETSPIPKPGNNAVTLLKGSCLFATVHINNLSEKICLSPALRSRFSEILLSELSPKDIVNVCEDYCLNSEHLRSLARPICDYLSAVQESLLNAGYFQLTLKESVTWMKMMEGLASSLQESEGTFNWVELFLVTARFVLLDPAPQAKRSVVGNAFMNSLGIEISEKEGSGDEVVHRVSDTAQTLREEQIFWFYRGQSVSLGRSLICDVRKVFKVSNGYIKLRDLPIAAKFNERSDEPLDDAGLEERFNFTLTQTSLSNIARILASMASDLPLLLEGPPGIGKTAVVVQCAKFLGYKVERINFTKDTSVDTLIGKHIPRMDEHGGHLVFTWQDGRALEAYMNGSFLLLDEINLASQEVLDELKTIIDPAIRSYTVKGESKQVNRHGDFRVFATMNPASVGGGRGRLPQSIESMFMKVHLQKYSPTEETQICIDRFASSGLIGNEGSVLGEKELHGLVSLHQEIKELVECKDIGKQGGPYEFNVRDLLKARDVIKGNLFSLLSHLQLNETDIDSSDVQQAFLSDVARTGVLRTSCELVYSKRFLSLEDQEKVTKIVDNVFVPPKTVVPDVTLDLHIPGSVRIGFVYLSKGDYKSPFPPLIQTASLNRYLQLLASAVLSGRVVFLQGPTCSRKTSLVCELSRICCRKLHIIPLSEDTETDRLIGRWSPCQSTAIPQALLEKCRSIFTESLKCFLSLGLAFAPPDVRYQLLDQLFTVLEKFHQAEKEKNYYLLFESVENLWKAFDLVIISNEDADFENKPVIQAQLKTEQRLLNDCLATIRRYDQSGSDDGKGFHFVESLLVEALRKGEWVLLDNLSAAPSDVVERILSLAETPQTLHLFESPGNETLSSDGGIEPEFRLFATVNSSRDGQDKLSSALLNRVISLWLPALDADALVNFRRARKVWTGTELYNIIVRQMAEFPASPALAKVLTKLHCGLSDMWCQGRLETVGRVEFTGRTALRAAKRVVQLCRRRAPPVEALAAAVGEHYVKCCIKRCQSVAMKVLAEELNGSFSKNELQQSPSMATTKEPENVQAKSLLIPLCRKTLADLFCFIIGLVWYHLTVLSKTPKNADISAALTFIKRITQKSLKLTSQTDDLKAHLSRVDTAVIRTELADVMKKIDPFRALLHDLEEYGVALSKATNSDVQCKAVGVEELRGYSDVVKSNLQTLGETVEVFLKKSSFSCWQDHLSFSVKLSDCLKAAQEVIWHSGWLSLFASQRKAERASGAQDVFVALQTVENAVVKCSQQISLLQTSGTFLPHLDMVCKNLYASDASGTGVCGTVLHRILEEEILVSCERNRLIDFLNGHKLLPTKSLAQMKLLFAVIELLVGTSSSVPYQLREVKLMSDQDISLIVDDLSLVECSQYVCSQLCDLWRKALYPVVLESRRMRKRLEGLADVGSNEVVREQAAVSQSVEHLGYLSIEFMKSRETVLNSDDANYLFNSYQQNLRTQHCLIFRQLAALKMSTEDKDESYRSLLRRLRPQELVKSIGPLWITVFSELRKYFWSDDKTWEICLVTSESDLNSEVAQRSLDQLIIFVSDDNACSKFGMVTVSSKPNGKALVFCSETSDTYQETLLASVVELIERRRSHKAMWISVVEEATSITVNYQHIAQFLPAMALMEWNVNEGLQNSVKQDIVITTEELRKLEQSFSEQCQKLESVLRQSPEQLVRHQLLKVTSCMKDLLQLPIGIADCRATDWDDLEKRALSFERTLSDLKRKLEGDLTARKRNVIPLHPHQRQHFLMKVEFELSRHLGRLSRDDTERSPCSRTIRLLTMIKESAKERTDMAEFLRRKPVLSVVRALTRTVSVIANGIVLAADVKSPNWALEVEDKYAPLRDCLKIGDHEDGVDFLCRQCHDLTSRCTDVFATVEHFDEENDITLDYDRLRTELVTLKAVITDVRQALSESNIELELVDGRDCLDVLTQVIGDCYRHPEDTEKKEVAPSNLSGEHRKEMERRLEQFITDLTNLYHSVNPRPVALIVSIARDIREATRQLESIKGEDEEGYSDFTKPEALTRLAKRYKDDVDSLLASVRAGQSGRVTKSFQQSMQRKELQDIALSPDRIKPRSETSQHIRYKGSVADLVQKAESIYQKDSFDELVQLTTKLETLVRLSVADSRWNFIYSQAEELCNCVGSETEAKSVSYRERQTILADLIAVQDRSRRYMATTNKLLTSSSLSVSDMVDVATTLLYALLQTRCDHYLTGTFDSLNSFTALRTVCKPVAKHRSVQESGTLLNVEEIVNICLRRCETFDALDPELYRNETTRLRPFPVRLADLHFGVMETDSVGCTHFMESERQMERELPSGHLSKPRHLPAVVAETDFLEPTGLTEFCTDDQTVDSLCDNFREFHLKSMEGFVTAFNDFFTEYDAGDAKVIRSCYRSLSEVPEYTVITGVVGVCSCTSIMNGLSLKVQDGSWDFLPHIQLRNEEQQSQNDKQRIDESFLKEKRDLDVSYNSERSCLRESDTSDKEEKLKRLDEQHRKKIEELQRKKEKSLSEQLTTARGVRLRKFLSELSNRLEKVRKTVEEYLKTVAVVCCSVSDVKIPPSFSSAFILDKQCLTANLPFIAFLTEAALKYSHTRQKSADVSKSSPESGNTSLPNSEAVEETVRSLLSFFETHCSVGTPFSDRLQRLIKFLSACAGSLCSGVGDIERKRLALHQHHSTTVLDELCVKSQRFATRIEEDCDELYSQCVRPRAELEVVCSKGQAALKLITDLRDGEIATRLLHDELIHTSNMVMKFLVLVLLLVERREKFPSNMRPLRLSVERLDPILMEEYSSKVLETELVTAYKHVRSAAQQLGSPIETLLFEFVGDLYPLAMMDASVAKQCNDLVSASVYGQALGRKLTWFLRIPEVGEMEVKHIEESLNCLQTILNQAANFKEVSDSFTMGYHDEKNISLSLSFEQCYELTDKVQSLCDNLIFRSEIDDASKVAMENAKLFVHQLYRTLLGHYVRQFRRSSQPRPMLESAKVDEQSLQFGHFINFARVVELNEIVFRRNAFFYSVRLSASFLFDCILATGQLLDRHICEMPVAPVGLSHIPEILDNFVNVLSTCTKAFAIPASRIVPMEDLSSDNSTEAASQEGIEDVMPAILQYDSELWEKCRQHVCSGLKKYVSASMGDKDKHMEIVKEIKSSTDSWKGGVDRIYSRAEATIRKLQGHKGLVHLLVSAGTSIKNWFWGTEKQKAKKVSEYLGKKKEATKILQEACESMSRLFLAHPNEQSIGYSKLAPNLFSAIERYNNMLLRKEGLQFAELFDVRAVQDMKCSPTMVNITFSLKQMAGYRKVFCTECRPSVETDDKTNGHRHEEPGQSTTLHVPLNDDIKDLKLSLSAKECDPHVWELPRQTSVAILAISTPQTYKEDIPFKVYGIEVIISLSCTFHFEVLHVGKTLQHESCCFDDCCAKALDVVNKTETIDSMQWSTYPDIRNVLSKLKGGELYKMEKKIFDDWEVNQLASGRALRTLTHLVEQTSLAKTNAETIIQQLNTMTFDDYVLHANGITKLLSVGVLDDFKCAQQHLNNFMNCSVPQCSHLLQDGRLSNELSSSLLSLTNLCRLSQDLASRNYAIAAIVRGGLALLCTLTARRRQEFSKCQRILQTVDSSTSLEGIPQNLRDYNANVQYAAKLTSALLRQAHYVEKTRSSCEIAAAKLLAVKGADDVIPYLKNGALLKCRHEPSLHLHPTDTGFQLSSKFLSLHLSSLSSDQWGPATKLTIFNHSELYEADFEFDTSVDNDVLAINPAKGVIRRSQHRIVTLSFAEKRLRDGGKKNTDMKQLSVLTVAKHNIDCNGDATTGRCHVPVLVTGRLQCIDDQLQVYPQRVQFGPLRTGGEFQTKWVLVQNNSEYDIAVTAVLTYHDGTNSDIADLSYTVDSSKKEKSTANDPLHWSLDALSSTRIPLTCTAQTLPGRLNASFHFQFASGKEETVMVKCIVAKPQFVLCIPGSRMSVISENDKQLAVAFDTKTTNNVQNDTVLISNTGVIPFLVSETVYRDGRYPRSAQRENRAISVLLPRASMELKVLYKEARFEGGTRSFSCAGRIVKLSLPVSTNRVECHATFKKRHHVVYLPTLSSVKRETKRSSSTNESCHLIKQGEFLLTRPLSDTLSLSNKAFTSVNVHLKSVDERLLFMKSNVEIAGRSSGEVDCEFHPTTAPLSRVPLAVAIYARPGKARTMLYDNSPLSVAGDVTVAVPVKTVLAFDQTKEQEPRCFLVMDRLTDVDITEHRISLSLCGKGTSLARYQVTVDTVNCSIQLQSLRTSEGKPPPWTGYLSTRNEIKTVKVRHLYCDKVVGCSLTCVSEDGYTIVSGEVVPAVSTLYLVGRSVLVTQSNEEERCHEILKTVDKSFTLLRELLSEIANDQNKAAVKVASVILNRFPFSYEGGHSEQQFTDCVMKAAESGDLLSLSNILLNVDSPNPVDIAEPGRILSTTQENKLLTSVLCTLSSLQSVRVSLKLEERFFDAVSESLILSTAKSWPHHWGRIHKFISALSSLVGSLQLNHSTTTTMTGVLKFLSTLEGVCKGLPSVTSDKRSSQISLAKLTKCYWYQDVTMHTVPEAAVNLCCFDGSTIDDVMVALQPLISGKHVAFCRLESALKLSLKPCDVLNIARQLKQDLTEENTISERVLDSLSTALNSNPFECISFQSLLTLLCDLVSLCGSPEFTNWVKSTMSNVVLLLTTQKLPDPSKLKEVLSDLLLGATFDEKNRGLCKEIVSNLETMWRKNASDTCGGFQAAAKLVSLFLKGVYNDADYVSAFDQVVACLISASRSTTAISSTNLRQRLLSALQITLPHCSTFLKDIIASSRSVIEGFHRPSSVGSVLPCLFEIVRVIVKVFGEDPSDNLKQFQECLRDVTGLSENGHLSRLIGAFGVARMIFQSHRQDSSQAVENHLRYLIMCLENFQSQDVTDEDSVIEDVDESTELLGHDESASSYVRESLSSDFFSLARCIILLGLRLEKLGAYERFMTKCRFLCSAEFPRLVGQCFASPLPTLASAMVDVLTVVTESEVESKLRRTAERIGCLINSRLQFRRQMVSSLLSFGLETAVDCSVLQEDLDMALSMLSRVNQEVHSAPQLRCLKSQDTDTSRETQETVRIALANIEWYDVSLSNYFRFVARLCNTANGDRLSSTAEELYSVALKRLACLPGERDVSALSDAADLIGSIRDMLPRAREDHRQLLDRVAKLISLTRKWNKGQGSLLFATEVLQNVLAIATLTPKVQPWSDILYLFQQVSKQKESDAKDSIINCYKLLQLNRKDSLNLPESFWDSLNRRCDEMRDDAGNLVRSNWKHLEIFLEELRSCTASESHTCACLKDILHLVFNSSKKIDFQYVVSLVQAVDRLIPPTDAKASSILCNIVSLLQSVDDKGSSWEQNLQNLTEEKEGIVDYFLRLVGNLSSEKHVLLADALSYCTHLAIEGGVTLDCQKQETFNDIFLVSDELMSNPECSWQDVRRLIDTLFKLFDPDSGFLLSNGQTLSPQMILSILDALDLCWHSEASEYENNGRQCRMFSLSAVALYELALHVAVTMKVPISSQSAGSSPEADVTASLDVDEASISQVTDNDGQEEQQLGDSSGMKSDLHKSEEVEMTKKDVVDINEFDTLMGEFEEMFRRRSTSRPHINPVHDFSEESAGTITRQMSYQRSVDADEDGDETDFLCIQEGILSFKEPHNTQVYYCHDHIVFR